MLDGGPEEGVVGGCEKRHDAGARTLRVLSGELQLCSEAAKSKSRAASLPHAR